VDLGHPEIAGSDNTVIAIASNAAIDHPPVPVFDREDTPGIADFIIERLELGRR
jgi:hypothetical protein